MKMAAPALMLMTAAMVGVSLGDATLSLRERPSPYPLQYQTNVSPLLRSMLRGEWGRMGGEGESDRRRKSAREIEQWERLERKCEGEKGKE